MSTIIAVTFIIPVREIKLPKATHELGYKFKLESVRFMNVIKESLSDVHTGYVTLEQRYVLTSCDAIPTSDMSVSSLSVTEYSTNIICEVPHVQYILPLLSHVRLQINATKYRDFSCFSQENAVLVA